MSAHGKPTAQGARLLLVDDDPKILVVLTRALANPELEVVESKKENTFGSDFTLYADQVTTLTEEPPATTAGQPARRPQ